MRSPDVLEELSQFVAASTWESVPAFTRERALVRLLDILAVSLPAYDSPIGNLALSRIAPNERTQDRACSHWLADGFGTPEQCAFSNSLLAHALLHDDVGQGGHPGANVVPAAFAVGEQVGATGAQILTAMAVGYEVQVRLGGTNLLHSIGDRGLRGTTATGAFGAAAAAASLLRLPAERVSSALAFAASLCVPGIEQPLLVGTDERCLQMAANTSNGVMAALLARDRFTGASSALSGECGFFGVYGGQAGNSPQAVEGLGTTWVSDAIALKPYPTAGWNTGPVYSALEIVRQHRLRVDDIAHVDVMHTWWHRNTAYVYSGPFETMEQALISCNFAVAAALRYGDYNWDVVKAAISDEQVALLAMKVAVDGVATWGFTDGAVTVVTRDGETLSADARNIPEELTFPSWSQAVAKFRRMIPDMAARADRIVQELEELPQSPSLTPLAALVRQPPPGT